MIQSGQSGMPPPGSRFAVSESRLPLGCLKGVSGECTPVGSIENARVKLKRPYPKIKA